MTNHISIPNSTVLYLKCRNILFLLMAFQLICWTSLPALILQNPYIDVLENIVWGQHGQWGYDKNPYFVPWLSNLSFKLTREAIWPFYLLSQISIVVCFFAVWRLSLKMLNPLQALIAVALLISIQYFSLGTTEFNDNVSELALWALICLNFYTSTEQQKLSSWILVGLFSGLAMMTKYYFIVLGLTMLAFLLLNAKARTSFKCKGLYIALGIFTLICLPNFIWLMQNDFVAIHYALNRANADQQTLIHWQNHFIQPGKYLLSMLGVIVPTLGILLLCFGKSIINHMRSSKPAVLRKFDRQFLLIVGLGPIFITTLLCALSGAGARYMWSAANFNLIGIVLIAFLRPELSTKRLKIFSAIISIVFILWLLVFIWQHQIRPFQRHKGSYESFPGRDIANKLTTVWQQRFQTKLHYIAGPRLTASNIAVFSTDKPQAYFAWKQVYSQWIDETDLRRQGAIFAWKTHHHQAQLPQDIAKRFPRARLQGIYYFDWAINGKLANKLKLATQMHPVQIAVALLPPNNT